MEGKKHPRLSKEWLKTRGFEHKKNDRVTDKLYQLLYLLWHYTTKMIQSRKINFLAELTFRRNLLFSKTYFLAKLEPFRKIETF